MRRVRRRTALAPALVALASCTAASSPGAVPHAPPAAVSPSAAPGTYGPEPEVKLGPIESRALDAVRARLGERGSRPRPSGALSLAARELARAAALGESEPLARGRVRAALARALAYDAAPVALIVTAPAAAALDALAAALPRARATHAGAGASERGGSVVLVVLTSERQARLQDFPRDVAPGAVAVLRGKLGAGLSQPRVFLTLPSGVVIEKAAGTARDFEARLEFPERGAYAVEVVGTGAGGPEVAALFAVSAGGASLDAPAERSPEDPADDAEAEAAVLRAVNALRRRHGLPPLVAAPELAGIARRHSAVMAAQGRVAHVLPGSGEVGGRLRAAGVPYRGVYENVARASTALGAHETLEGSPAHRGNLLRPDAARVGVGIARVERTPGDRAVYLTEVLVAPLDDGAESPLTPEGRVREALWRERQRLRLPALSSDVALDELAREAARELHRRDGASPDALGDRALALGRRTIAAVDAFVASGPAEAIRSANLRDPRFARVGVGVAMGDSRRFGAGRLWIAVVYTD